MPLQVPTGLYPYRGALFIAAGLVLIMFLLSGCVEGSLSKLQSTSTAPACTALIGPIKYNSQKRTSARFAGPKLAPDLKQRNQVGENLHCPQYR